MAEAAVAIMQEPVVAPSGAMRLALDDGRWHFQHGPIDLIIQAGGDADAVRRATENAWLRFGAILPELVAELAQLRQPVRGANTLQGPVARRMYEACGPHSAQFITPMAAVAGAVADEIIAFFRNEAGVERAYVNNGGDIALHLSAGQSYKVGLFTDLARFDGSDELQLDGGFVIDAALPVRGIATSGWRGRSFSLGIADSVTVLASNAATADAAATIVANAVNSDHPAVRRAPASSLKDDTDLGDLPVTVDVGDLPYNEVRAALEKGAARAGALLREGVIHGAVLALRGAMTVVGLDELSRKFLSGGQDAASV
ncbi:UPF0280 family protein [Eoetvoesiella sp.]|uniref:UPF0280 family protein n=1 Tax=Eoetvoesiella sp. TaxID=1966355 RepID=UPI0039C8911A